jgi:hypothetical protein
LEFRAGCRGPESSASLSGTAGGCDGRRDWVCIKAIASGGGIGGSSCSSRSCL